MPFLFSLMEQENAEIFEYGLGCFSMFNWLSMQYLDLLFQEGWDVFAVSRVYFICIC
jgi:hypothetical protein